MQTIYEPKGRALEYSPLALNLYTGCTHNCLYCFNKKMPWYDGIKFSKPEPRKGLLAALKKEAAKMVGDKRDILLCFTCDPYPPIKEDITREVLEIMECYDLKPQILTKAGARATRDFGLLQTNNWKFGTTLTLNNKADLALWEPGAAGYEDRVAAIRYAKSMGIYTWVSLEPVIKPEQTLQIIEDLVDMVDFWKIGKLNYMPELERGIDWHGFLKKATSILKGCKYMVKKDLLEAAK